MRLKTFKIFGGTTLLFLLLLGICIFYAFKIEPYRVTTNEMYINEKSSDVLKVVQFSDTRIKEDFTHKNLDKVVNKINEQNPDIVAFTGDLYDNYAKYHDDDAIIKELQKINSKYYKITIYGNHDYGGGAVKQYESIMEKSGFIVLKNENWYITTDTNKKILFTGLDDSMLGNVSMSYFTKVYKADYDILLTHEPDTADLFLEYPYDLVLSGHSHGGQFNFPVIPEINRRAISTTKLASKYSDGMYKLGTNTKVYVNTGIGTTHISARFGVVPEISVFTIYL